MYELALTAHSTLRLALTVLLLLLVVGGIGGVLRASRPAPLHKLWILLATILVDLQFVIGLLLWLVWSPETSQARSNMGAAMKDPTLRFWAVEHPAAMILVIVFVHLGKVLVARAGSDGARHRRMALWFGLALALVAFLSPWPYSAVPRPLWHL